MAALGFISGGSTTRRSRYADHPDVCVRTRQNFRARCSRVLCSSSTGLRIRNAGDTDVEAMIHIYEDAFLNLDAANIWSRVGSFWKSRRIKAQMIEMFANIKDTDDEHMNKVFLAESEDSGKECALPHGCLLVSMTSARAWHAADSHIFATQGRSLVSFSS